MYCSHSLLRKALAVLGRRALGRKNRRPAVEGVCPICGLLPRGDRVAEYVLEVVFIDGEIRKFIFRGRSPETCYRIERGFLIFHYEGVHVSYSMGIISTLVFSGRTVPVNPPVPNVIREAERIIAGADDDQE